MLLAIDPNIEERRVQLKKEHEALTKAQDWLQGLSRDNSAEDDTMQSGAT